MTATSIARKDFWAGQLHARIELVHVGGDVYQFEKTIGGQWTFKRGTLNECLLRGELAEQNLIASGFEWQFPGYNGGTEGVKV